MQKSLSWMGDGAGYKKHAADAEKTESCRSVGRGTNSLRTVAEKIEQWSLQGSVSVSLAVNSEKL